MTEVGPTVRFAHKQCSVRDQFRAPGQHNEAVFGKLLEISSKKIKELVERRVLS